MAHALVKNADLFVVAKHVLVMFVLLGDSSLFSTFSNGNKELS